MVDVTQDKFGTFKGISDDGRVTFNIDSEFVHIDGRLAYRRQYMRVVPGQILMADDGPVDEADWSIAGKVIHAVYAAAESHRAAREKATLDEAIADDLAEQDAIRRKYGSDAERVRRERDFDLGVNEGGEGYNPHRCGSVPTYRGRQ